MSIKYPKGINQLNTIQKTDNLDNNVNIHNKDRKKQLENQMKIDNLEFKLKMINQIYEFLLFITSKNFLIIFSILILVIIYPLSNIKIPFFEDYINNFIYEFSKYFLSGIKISITFILSLIINDWISSNLKFK